MPARLKLFSIFNSISGEHGGVPQGTLMTFIRFAGCNLKCLYCDTGRAISTKSGYEVSVDDVLKMIEYIGCHKVLITGGEPLMQGQAFKALVQELHSRNYYVQVETNGSFKIDTEGIDCWVVNYKLSGSREDRRMRPIEEFASLPYDSVIKFICTGEQDFFQAINIVEEMVAINEELPEIVFGATQPLTSNTLVKWLQQRRLWNISLNTQIYKWVFPEGESEEQNFLSLRPK